MQGLKDTLNSTFARIAAALHDRTVADPLGLPFIETPGDRLYLPYLISFVVISLGLYFFRDKNRETASDFLGFLFPRAIVRHRSAMVDYKFYVFGRVVGFLFLSSLVGVSTSFAGWVDHFIHFLFGPSPPSWNGQNLVLFQVFYFAALFLVADLAFFLSHILHHKSKFFWEFHKVHHSAEVLTPITNYRFHPVEKITSILIAGAITGTVVALFGYTFGRDIGRPEFLTLTLFNVGLSAFIFRVFGNHRHSHIWLSFGPVLEHLFISPAQHQMHHSREARHLDTNMGLQLAIWDWMFGTLYIAAKREHFALGLQNHEHWHYQSVPRLYFLPIWKAGLVLHDYACRGRAVVSRWSIGNW